MLFNVPLTRRWPRTRRSRRCATPTCARKSLFGVLDGPATPCFWNFDKSERIAADLSRHRATTPDWPSANEGYRGQCVHTVSRFHCSAVCSIWLRLTPSTPAWPSTAAMVSVIRYGTSGSVDTESTCNSSRSTPVTCRPSTSKQEVLGGSGSGAREPQGQLHVLRGDAPTPYRMQPPSRSLRSGY